MHLPNNHIIVSGWQYNANQAYDFVQQNLLSRKIRRQLE
jgi:hypothetical protein